MLGVDPFHDGGDVLGLCMEQDAGFGLVLEPALPAVDRADGGDDIPACDELGADEVAGDGGERVGVGSGDANADKSHCGFLPGAVSLPDPYQVGGRRAVPGT